MESTHRPHYSKDAILDSIVVSIPACHAGDQGSIPCRGVVLKNQKNEYGYLRHVDYAASCPNEETKATSFI